MKPLLPPLLMICTLLALWEGAVFLSTVPPYILPPPSAIFTTLWQLKSLLALHAATTALEILTGWISGASLGLVIGTLLFAHLGARKMLMPLLIISQALPVFALSPLLVLWLGFGLASKIAMATLMIFFPVSTACFYGLLSIPKDSEDLMIHLSTSSPLLLKRALYVRIPFALPQIKQGLLAAATLAPLAAIIAEWIGSAHGLGYLMMHSIAKMETTTMMAALFVLVSLALAFYLLVKISLSIMTSILCIAQKRMQNFTT